MKFQLYFLLNTKPLLSIFHKDTSLCFSGQYKKHLHLRIPYSAEDCLNPSIITTLLDWANLIPLIFSHKAFFPNTIPTAFY